MSIKNHIPASLHSELEGIMVECQSFYSTFDPISLQWQMFAMQILLARRLVELEQQFSLLKKE